MQPLRQLPPDQLEGGGLDPPAGGVQTKGEALQHLAQGRGHRTTAVRHVEPLGLDRDEPSTYPLYQDHYKDQC